MDLSAPSSAVKKESHEHTIQSMLVLDSHVLLRQLHATQHQDANIQFIKSEALPIMGEELTHKDAMPNCTAEAYGHSTLDRLPTNVGAVHLIGRVCKLWPILEHSFSLHVNQEAIF